MNDGLSGNRNQDGTSAGEFTSEVPSLPMTSHIVFRVDASLEMGSGHLMRCLTLADCLRNHGAITTFICRKVPDSLYDLILGKGHRCLRLPEHLEATLQVAKRLPHGDWLDVDQSVDAQDTLVALGSVVCQWLVVDHYALDHVWERLVRPACSRLLVIDDLADRTHDCDLLLDQNYYVHGIERYLGKLAPQSKQLLGPKYALLRPEFEQARRHLRIRDGVVRRVLLFFGGMDAENATGKAMDALEGLLRPEIAVDVVIGAQHPLREEILERCVRLGWYCHVQTSRMAELMAGADLAVGAGGSATWERCCLGLPTLTLVLASNQRQLVLDASAAGLLFTIESPRNALPSACDILLALQDLLAKPNQLHEVSRRCSEMVKGTGTDFVRRAMGISGVQMRKASKADADRLLRWRNHDKILSVSRNKTPIKREDHLRWLDVVLSNPTRLLLICVFREAEIGVVRFDCEGNGAEVSIYLNPEAPLQGWGGEMLQCAESFLLQEHPDIVRIRAEVLESNSASQRFFHSSGYQLFTSSSPHAANLHYNKQLK